MPTPVNGYCTLAEFRASFVTNWPSTDTSLDQNFCDIITAASRAIDQETSRHFYESTAHEVRYFTPRESTRIFVGDLVSVTALYTDNDSGDRTYPYTWATTDYDLWPYDAINLSEPEPYRFLDVTPRGLYRFPVGVAKAVKLDAIFGWPEVPQPIQKACLLYSYELYKFYQTPLSEAAGQPVTTAQAVKLVPMDPRITSLFQNYSANAV
jgi:hypothetical protein